jgi:hypothetical protein
MSRLKGNRLFRSRQRRLPVAVLGLERRLSLQHAEPYLDDFGVIRQVDHFRVARRTPTKDAAPPEGRAFRLLVVPFVQVCGGGRPVCHHRCAVLRGLKRRVLGITKTTGTSHSEFTARTST